MKRRKHAHLQVLLTSALLLSLAEAGGANDIACCTSKVLGPVYGHQPQFPDLGFSVLESMRLQKPC